MFRRRAQRPLQGMERPEVPPMLQRANQLMANEKYEEAAIAFKELAQRAEEHFPQRAPFLYMEAGHAAILSGGTKIGIANMWRGLTLLASQERFHRMWTFGQRAVDELRALKLNAQAEEISVLINSNLPREVPTTPIANTKRPTLPTHCPSCGAAIRSGDVEWIDKVTVECDYCGSPVRAENN